MKTAPARWLSALTLAVALAGCATPLAAPSGSLPDLAGTWSGTWGGQPARLVVTEQGDQTASGINLGPWPIAGGRLPGLSGVLTFASGGQPTTVNVRGRFGGSGGRLTLVLESVAADGPSFTLTEVTPTRLAGVGTQSAPWQPNGSVELQRISPPP